MGEYLLSACKHLPEAAEGPSAPQGAQLAGGSVEVGIKSPNGVARVCSAYVQLIPQNPPPS